MKSERLHTAASILADCAIGCWHRVRPIPQLKISPLPAQNESGMARQKNLAQFFGQNHADCARMMPFDPTNAAVNRRQDFGPSATFSFFFSMASRKRS